MLLQRLSNPGRTLTSLGLFCLVAGATTGTVLRHHAPLSLTWDVYGDAIYGLFYGMAIGLMLLGVRMNVLARRR